MLLIDGAEIEEHFSNLSNLVHTALFGTLLQVVAVGTNMSYVEKMQLFPSGVRNERKVKGTWVQYAATRKQKVGMLQILLDAG